MKITKDMTINQTLGLDKSLAGAFLMFGLMCFGCPSAEKETLEEASVVHGIDLDEMIKTLNEEYELILKEEAEKNA